MGSGDGRNRDDAGALPQAGRGELRALLAEHALHRLDRPGSHVARQQQVDLGDVPPAGDRCGAADGARAREPEPVVHPRVAADRQRVRRPLPHRRVRLRAPDQQGADDRVLPRELLLGRFAQRRRRRLLRPRRPRPRGTPRYPTGSASSRPSTGTASGGSSGPVASRHRQREPVQDPADEGRQGGDREDRTSR